MSNVWVIEATVKGDVTLDIINFDEVSRIETSDIISAKLIKPSPMGNGQFFNDEFGFNIDLKDGSSKSFLCTYYDDEYEDLKHYYQVIIQELRNNKIQVVLLDV